MDDLEWLQSILDEKFQGNQAAMARWLERQPAQINQYLKGRRKIGADFREHVRSKMGISSDWPFSMFTLEEYKSLPESAYWGLSPKGLPYPRSKKNDWV